MGLLNINLNDLDRLHKSYESFLNFIDRNICNKVMTNGSIISKEQFYEVLKIHINNIKEYLKGKEELLISKNFILKVQNRWNYIEKMFHILEESYLDEIERLNNSTAVFDTTKWNTLLSKLDQPNSYDKGKAMETLAEYFLSCTNGIKITGKNVRHFREEIDLCCCNYSNDSSLWKMGSLILVECKNQVKNIPSKTLRNLIHVMESKGVCTTILFTASKLTGPALQEIEQIRNFGKYFIVITLEDLLNLKTSPSDMLEDKINDTFF